MNNYMFLFSSVLVGKEEDDSVYIGVKQMGDERIRIHLV